MQPVVQDPTDIGPRYNQAVENRDVNALTSLAKETVGTPASQIALDAAAVIRKNAEGFGKLLEPIEKKGGAATPEGRLEIEKQFQTTADNPRWGTALIKYMLGDKQGASRQITGGDITKKITYDNNGDQIEETVNSLGEPLSYVDRKTGKNLTKKEYADRVGGISSWNNTLFGITQKQLREKSTEALVKDEEATNHWFGLTQSHKPAWQEIYNTLRASKTDVPAALYNDIVRSMTSSLGQASSASRSSQTLDQLNRTISQGEGAKVSESLASALGLEAGLQYVVKGNKVVSTDGRFSKEIGALAQSLNSSNISSEAQKNASMTRDSILKAEKLKQLSPEMAQKLLRTMELSQQIGNETMQAVDKYGKPAFISLPTAATIENKQAQIMAQALQGMHNAEQMGTYMQYRKNAMEGYKSTNTVPLPGAISAGYASTPVYKDLRGFFASKIDQVMSENFEPEAKAKPAKTQAGSGPVRPPQALPRGIPEGSTLTNLRTPDGLRLWKDRKGQLHTED